jgi:hypothetical protein
VRCGGDHPFENCPNKEKPKCVHCKGEHSAAYGGCPEYKKNQKIIETKVTQGISYSEAVKKVDKEKAQGEREPKLPTPPQAPNLTSRAGGEDGVYIDPMKFILFMIDTIINSFQATSKSERIKIITDSANNRLGLNLDVDKILTNLLEKPDSQNV